MAVNVVSFSFSWCSTGGPAAQLSAGWWLSLLHLISIFSGSQLIRAPSPFGLVWLSLPLLVYNSVSNSTATATWFLSWLSYIIVQRPLDLWNGMIDRHPAEITVMQFTGHSLPVHHSMSVSWALPCPISSAKSDYFRLLAIGMCHFLPVYHFVMACLLGPKVKIQHWDPSLNQIPKYLPQCATYTAIMLYLLGREPVQSDPRGESRYKCK